MPTLILLECRNSSRYRCSVPPLNPGQIRFKASRLRDSRADLYRATTSEIAASRAAVMSAALGCGCGCGCGGGAGAGAIVGGGGNVVVGAAVDGGGTGAAGVLSPDACVAPVPRAGSRLSPDGAAPGGSGNGVVRATSVGFSGVLATRAS